MKNTKINLNEKNSQNFEIKLPCGAFCGSNNCTDCVYANWDDQDEGWIKCNNSKIDKNYVDPGKRYGCWHYQYKRS